MGTLSTYAWIGTGPPVSGCPHRGPLSIVHPQRVRSKTAVRTRYFATIPISTGPTTTTDVLSLILKNDVNGETAGRPRKHLRHPWRVIGECGQAARRGGQQIGCSGRSGRRRGRQGECRAVGAMAPTARHSSSVMTVCIASDRTDTGWSPGASWGPSGRRGSGQPREMRPRRAASARLMLTAPTARMERSPSSRSRGCQPP